MGKIQYLEAPKHTSKLARFLSTRQRELDEWAFVHIKIINPAEYSMDEMLQFLGYQFQDSSAIILTMRASNEIVVVTKNQNNIGLIRLEGQINKTVSKNAVEAAMFPLHKNNLAMLSNILIQHLAPEDVTTRINLKRMQRKSNTMMVVDDDFMVCRQFENILGGFGECIIQNDTQDFFEAYVEHAPDILFLDIHLQTDHGPDLMKKLRDTIDQHAHIVMISSDTYETTIREVKEKGAKGFIVKPLNRQQLFTHVMKMPTFSPREKQMA